MNKLNSSSKDLLKTKKGLSNSVILPKLSKSIFSLDKEKIKNNEKLMSGISNMNLSSTRSKNDGDEKMRRDRKRSSSRNNKIRAAKDSTDTDNSF